MSKGAVVIDIWSELNRGDGAMQFTMFELLKQSGFSVKAIADYGASDLSEFAHEFDVSNLGPGDVVSSLKFTNYAFLGRCKSLHFRRGLVLCRHLVNHVLFYLYSAQLLSGILVSRRLIHFRNVIRSSDKIIWNGRNFRSNRISLEYFETFDLLFTYRLVRIIKGKKVDFDIPFVGVSVWPFRSLAAQRLFCKHASTATLYSRESATQKYLEEILGIGSSQLLPDLSFYFLDRNLAINPRESAGSRELSVEVVGVVLKEWTVDGLLARKQYLNTLVSFLVRIGAKKCLLVDQVPMIKESVDAISAEFIEMAEGAGVSVDVADVSGGVDSLLAIYSSMDIIISSRMHGAIFGLGCGTVPVCIAYDEGAKWSILRDLGVQVSCSFGDVSLDALVDDLRINHMRVDNAILEIRKGSQLIAEAEFWR